MAFFGFNPEEDENNYNEAKANPYVPDLSPAWYEGALDSAYDGLGAAQMKVDRLYRNVNNIPEDDTSRLYDDAIKGSKPDPETTGILGQVLYGLSTVLYSAGVGGLLGGTPGAAAVVGGAEGVNTTRELTNDGVDTDIAQLSGGISGVANAIGVAMPGAIGAKVLTKVATGSAMNAGVGAVERGSIGTVLEAGGYADMADQYHAIDKGALFTDFVLGGLFGAIDTGTGSKKSNENTAINPSDVDAALYQNSVNQLEIDAAPGIPLDTASRNAHINASETAIAQLIRGEDVDVGSIVEGANFMPKPLNEAAAKALDEMFAEQGYHDIIAETQRLRAEAENKGIPFDKEEVPLLTPAELQQEVQTRSAESLANASVAVNGKEVNLQADKSSTNDITNTQSIEHQIVAEKPDMVIPFEKGEVNATKALKDASDNITKAEEDSKLFEVAVNCAIRNG
jgi:hypothetical protein